jgi:hypothetical protein
VFGGGAVLIALTGPDMITSFSAAASSFGNVGPGLGDVGPTRDYLALSWPARVVTMVQMLLGRLEIYPVILALSVFTLRRRLHPRPQLKPASRMPCSSEPVLRARRSRTAPVTVDVPASTAPTCSQIGSSTPWRAARGGHRSPATRGTSDPRPGQLGETAGHAAPPHRRRSRTRADVRLLRPSWAACSGVASCVGSRRRPPTLDAHRGRHRTTSPTSALPVMWLEHHDDETVEEAPPQHQAALSPRSRRTTCCCRGGTGWLCARPRVSPQTARGRRRGHRSRVITRATCARSSAPGSNREGSASR